MEELGAFQGIILCGHTEWIKTRILMAGIVDSSPVLVLMVRQQTISDQILPLCNLSCIWSDNMTGHESKLSCSWPQPISYCIHHSHSEVAHS